MNKANWKHVLHYDPLPVLLSSHNEAIAFFTAKDLLGKVLDTKSLWDLPEAQKIVRAQQPNGSWKYPGGNNAIRSAENYDQIETYRNLGYLVEMFGFDKTSPVVARAAEFMFRFQTDAGDIRGILGNQYTPYYTAGILELLIKAGYAGDKRVEAAFKWLASIRQNDGGWAIPLRTRGKKLDVIAMGNATLEPDRSKPFSHLVTGMVLRAYAADEKYRSALVAKTAADLLLTRLFKKDEYSDRGSADFWVRFTYPFWFTDLVSATDSLSKLGFSKDEPHMQKAVQWFIDAQQKDGAWKLKTLKNGKKYPTDLWLDLAICRILQRLYK
ncbi:MAG TPA: hypothetical protein VIQ80_00895 [Candidatus Saccharimonadales bacterium]